MTAALSSISLQMQSQESWIVNLNVTSDIREENEVISQKTLETMTFLDLSKNQKEGPTVSGV